MNVISLNLEMNQPGGLAKSLGAPGLEWDNKFGRPHNALADAHNTLLTYFKIADDGFRFTDVEVRNNLDKSFKKALDAAFIEYEEITTEEVFKWVK